MKSGATIAAILPLLAVFARAHGDHAEIDENSDYTYAEMHMAQEHHMDSFNIQAFFHLHDLNRDGVLDRNELESVYGVHHEKRKKGAKSLEVHTEQAKEIVTKVLEKLDENGDGVLTMREFVAGGVGGLPNFKGVEHLGHHYDAEGEYFLHHEEQFHNTPETQREEDYIHPEDIEHFMSHEQIEAEEEEKVAVFTGEEPDIPSDERVTAEEVQQHIFNELNGLSDEPTEVEKESQRELDEHVGAAGGGGGGGASKVEKSWTSVHAKDDEATISAEEQARRDRAEFARQQAAKFGKDVKEASRRGEWGTGESAFERPRDAADRLRKNIPYKYKPPFEALIYDLDLEPTLTGQHRYEAEQDSIFQQEVASAPFSILASPFSNLTQSLAQSQYILHQAKHSASSIVGGHGNNSGHILLPVPLGLLISAYQDACKQAPSEGIQYERIYDTFANVWDQCTPYEQHLAVAIFQVMIRTLKRVVESNSVPAELFYLWVIPLEAACEALGIDNSDSLHSSRASSQSRSHSLSHGGLSLSNRKRSIYFSA
ncbi:nucleobindin SSP120 [Sporobolomyces salmoneus]|uniref:nucleobindin SSP120 n=1 Tax=Sporobolomyces salmoneus TaxID=183962 RepID=UPI00317E5D08